MKSETIDLFLTCKLTAQASEERLRERKEALLRTQEALATFVMSKLASDEPVEHAAASEALHKLADSLRGSTSAEDRRLLLQVLIVLLAFTLHRLQPAS